MTKRKRSRLNQKSIKRRSPSLGPQERVLIVTEGSKTEPDYFNLLIKELKLTATRVKIVSHGGSAPTSVVKTAKECLGEDGDFEQVYCVFDKYDHQGYKDAIRELEQRYRGKKIHTITSVPCFEVWYLVHVSTTSKHYETQNKLLRDLKKHPPFQNYEKNDCDSFFDKISAQREDALKQAKRLLTQARQSGAGRFHENPSTRVYQVVEALTEISKKQISGK